MARTPRATWSPRYDRIIRYPETINRNPTRLDLPWNMPDGRTTRNRQKAEADAQALLDQARQAELRKAWEQLCPAEREAILATVKVENPGLSRWKNMLEPLCLAALETRDSRVKESSEPVAAFYDSDSVADWVALPRPSILKIVLAVTAAINGQFRVASPSAIS